MINEIWKQVVGYEGLYEVSNYGRVKSLAKTIPGLFGSTIYLKEKIRKNQKYPNGYEYVGLSNNGKVKTHLVHRLVALAFIPNPDNLPEVNHKNEQITDNRVENLEWVTHKENANYGTRNQRASEKREIPILQYSLEGEFITEWTKGAMSVQKKYGWNRTNICACCKGKQQSAYGFKWAYKE